MHLQVAVCHFQISDLGCVPSERGRQSQLTVKTHNLSLIPDVTFFDSSTISDDMAGFLEVSSLGWYEAFEYDPSLYSLGDVDHASEP